MPVLLAEIRNAPIDPTEVCALVYRSDAGAVVQFVGVVRDHDPGASGRVEAIVYTCHPSAPQLITPIVLAAIAESLACESDESSACVAAERAAAIPVTAERVTAECVVAACHRIGRLEVGDVAFVVAVSAAHRKQAFMVCEAVVEKVKAELPIWKQQFEQDGSYSWSGL